MQYILFDLDGTLIDHFTTIHKSVAFAQRKLGLPQSDYSEVRQTVGGSVPITLSKLCGEDKVSLAEPLFRKRFEEIMRGPLSQLPTTEQRGEVVVVVGPGTVIQTERQDVGPDLKAIASSLAVRWGCTKREAYNALLALETGRNS